MKKKMISALLVATMVAGTFAGCGSKPAADNQTTNEATDDAAGETAGETADAEPATDDASGEDIAAADEGKVLNIQCWNEEFKSRLTAHYPGYEEVDGTTGKIGDVNVKWTITHSDENAYKNKMEEIQ